MGTVGLSFGSPTSGTGFDVSATVTQIVGNLRNVETPWKSQLTTLQGQDTVLSNLGTLFSKLSSDLKQLTDFQGVLAQKTGASSDTNVLQLTAASTTAVAGTHTVAVNNLAQTSSGYLDAISSSSDKLSGTLSITLNGNTQTIDLSKLSNPILAGLSTAINSSGVGVTASVLNDAAGARLSLVSGTSGGNGQMTVTSTITDPSMVSAANTTGAMGYHPTVDGKNASLLVDGVPLTSATNIVTNLIPGVTFHLLSPSKVDSVGNNIGVQVVIGNDNTDVESAIAAMVTDYNSLISAINAQQGNDGSGNPEPLYGSPTLSLLQQQLLSGINKQNPNGYLDSIASSSDKLSGSIQIAVGNGAAQNIDITSLTDQAMPGLASAINSAGIGVTANIVADSVGSHLVFVSATAGAAGALKVTSAITDAVTNKLVNYNSGESDIAGLGNLGISMNNDGSISLDASTLDSVLNSDFSAVTSFFQNANSWGTTFSNILDNSGVNSSKGILKLAGNANSTTESNLNASIAKEETMIAAQQKVLTVELNTANEILQALPSQLESTNMLYSAITGYNQNKG
jgi:flagellar hook-associated protein 2